MTDEERAATTPCLVARCKCGCGGIILAIASAEQIAKSSDEIGRAAVDGYQISTITVAEARADKWFCQQEPQP